VRIVAFNTSQSCSRDVSAEIAAVIKERYRKGEELSPGLSEWIERLELAESVLENRIF
jgi:hypothetical protein